MIFEIPEQETLRSSFYYEKAPPPCDVRPRGGLSFAEGTAGRFLVERFYFAPP